MVAEEEGKMRAELKEVKSDSKREVAHQLLEELFLENYTHSKGEHISPLNAGSVGPKLDQAERVKRQKEKELYDSLVEVERAIKRDGGISGITYEDHHYAINKLARALAELEWWGGDLYFRCEREDREGKRATEGQARRFPNDGDYGTNIFDEGGRRSNFEGTLFYVELDGDDNLKSLRIFHQGHRDRLSVRTVDIAALKERIHNFVVNFTEAPPTSKFDFPLSREEYLRKIKEWNQLFGARATIKIVGNEEVVVEFDANPQQVAERLVELGKREKLNLTARMGPTSYIVTRKAGGYVDLFLPRHLQNDQKPFDPVEDRGDHAVLLPYLRPEVSNPLIAMYVAQEEK